MSKGGGTSTIKQDIPLWLQQAGAENYVNAVNISQRPYQQAPNAVAGLNGTNQQVFNSVNNLQGMSANGYGQAADATSGIMNGYQPQQVQTQFGMQNVGSQNVAGNAGAINAAMSPYTDNVERYGLQAIDQERQAALNTNADQAFQSGGFGGSRSEVVNATTNALAAQKAGALSAQLRDQAYNNATGLLSQDAARNLAAQQTNAQNYMAMQGLNAAGQQFNSNAAAQAAQLRLGAAQQLGQLTGQQLDGTAKEIGLLDTTAGQQRAYEQALLDQGLNNFNASYNYPIQMQNLRQSALGLAPYSTTQTQTTTGGGSALGGAAGGAALGGSIAGALGASSGWGALAGAALGGAASSDPDLKKNVRREGTDPDTGAGIFSWDYKDDPANAPRRLGLMADGPGGIKSTIPEAFTEIGGAKGILTDKLPENLRQIAAPSTAPAMRKPVKKVRR